MAQPRKPSKAQADLITEEEARSALEPVHGPLVTAVHRAFTIWKDVVAPNLTRVKESTRAGFIHDSIETQLRTALGSNADVEFAPTTSDRFWFRIKPKSLLVRIKKLNSALTTSNYRTESANKFDRQQQLDHVPIGSRVTLGYRPKKDNTGLLGVWIALFKGQRLLWKYELLADPASGVVSIAPTPILPLAPAGLKLKTSAKKKKKDAG